MANALVGTFVVRWWLEERSTWGIITEYRKGWFKVHKLGETEPGKANGSYGVRGLRCNMRGKNMKFEDEDNWTFTYSWNNHEEEFHCVNADEVPNFIKDMGAKTMEKYGVIA